MAPDPKEPSFTIGIEEEYLLVDKATRDLTTSPPKKLMVDFEAALKDQVCPEFLKSQIEVNTHICTNLQQARREIAGLRQTVAEISAQHNLAPIAASTHPFASWLDHSHTDKERYQEIARDLQFVGRRMIICGMHVHIGIDDDELRIDLLNQASYFLPHLLALSASSPFWRGENTGFKSYRLSIFDELPRTGIPQQFLSFSEYCRTIDILIKAGLIEDTSKIWWDLRLSPRFPTLEMRITDVCPRLDDTICIAAFFLCICRMLYRLRRSNQRWRSYPVFLLNENRWRAKRYGIDKGLVDFGKGEIIAFDGLLEELLGHIREDADYFGCLMEIEHVRTICARGTGADRQIKHYTLLKESGMSHEEALVGLVDYLIEETLLDT